MKYMVLSLSGSGWLDEHAKCIKSTIADMVDKMPLQDSKTKTLKAVQRTLDRFQNPQNLDVSSNYSTTAIQTNYESDMAYVKGLMQQIEDIRNGKIRTPQEVSAVQLLLLRI